MERSESFRALALRLEDEWYEATKMVEWYEAKLRVYVKCAPPWEEVLAFADWTAKLALVLDRRERMAL